MRRMSFSLQSGVRDAVAEPREGLTSTVAETGLTDGRPSVHHGANGLRSSITSAVLGEATGWSLPDPSPAAPPTPAADLSVAPAPENPSLN